MFFIPDHSDSNGYISDRPETEYAIEITDYNPDIYYFLDNGNLRWTMKYGKNGSELSTNIFRECINFI